MSVITFYKDKSDVFRCDVAIDGASLNESKIRLVLEFDNGKSYLFKGKVSSDGKVEIPVPKMNEENDSGGNATLEVIAENTFFEPWSGNFKLKSRKAVQVEGVSVGGSSEKKVLVNNVSGAKEKKVSKNQKLINDILESYNPRSKKQRAELSDYEPVKNVKDWGRKLFKERVDSPKAQYCMMVIESRMRKKRQ